MQRVELVLVLGLLRQDPLRTGNQFQQRSAARVRRLSDLPLDIAHHPADARAQRTQRVTHALVLLSVRARRLAVVVLFELEAVVRRGPDQMFATQLEQA